METFYGTKGQFSSMGKKINDFTKIIIVSSRNRKGYSADELLHYHNSNGVQIKKERDNIPYLVDCVANQYAPHTGVQMCF